MSDSQTTKEIQHSLDQIKAGQRLSEAFFDLGMHYMLSGDPERTLVAYASGICYSNDVGQIRAALEYAQQLASSIEQSAGSKVSSAKDNGDLRQAAAACAQQILQLGLAARFSDPFSTTAINEFATKGAKKLDRSVVVIVDSASDVQKYPSPTDKKTLISAFKDYLGTLIGGGTETTIGRICGDIQTIHPKRVYTIAYHSEQRAANVKLDQRYKEHRAVTQKPFTCAKPVQYWADILASRVKPANVRVVGASSAPNALLEYITAIALGSSVLMRQDLKEVVSAYAKDPLFSLLEKIVYYPDYPYILRTYVGTGLPSFPPPMREQVAKALHETYRITWSPHRSRQSMAEWENLSQELKESNFEAVDQVVQKFNEIGYSLELAEGFKLEPVDLTIYEVETLAAMEHDRWVLQRLLDGWRFGEEKSFEKRTDPSIRNWTDLDDEVRDVDRALVRKLPTFLAHFDVQMRKWDSQKA